MTKRSIPWFTLITSIGALIFAGVLFIQTQIFLASAITTQGQVISLTQHPARGGYTYAPVISFIDQHGLSHQFQSAIFTNSPQYKVGEPASVAYSPTNPEQAKLRDFTEEYVVPLGISIAAFISLFIVAGMIFFNYHKQKQAKRLSTVGPKTLPKDQ